MSTQKDYLDVDSKTIHEEMRKYFTPINDILLIEFTENIKSAGGIILPNAEKSLCHPVVAVGPDVKNIEAGDWISCKNISLDVFDFFGRKWAFCELFKIASKVIPTCYNKHAEIKREAEVKAAAKLAMIRNTDLNVVN